MKAENKELSLEEQLSAKRALERLSFEEKYKALVEETGYRLSPSFTINEQGFSSVLETVPIR